jgi:hypothetical protein
MPEPASSCFFASVRDSFDDVFARYSLLGLGRLVFSSGSYRPIVMESTFVLLSIQVAPDASVTETQQLA